MVSVLKVVNTVGLSELELESDPTCTVHEHGLGATCC